MDAATFAASVLIRMAKSHTPQENTMTKHSLYIVTIHGTDHAVRATGKYAATATALEARVETRKATDDDIIRIVRSGQPIIGDAVDPVDEAVASCGGSV